MRGLSKSDIDAQPMEHVADLRDWSLVRLEIINEVLKEKVIEAAAEGMSISDIAKKTSVNRRTIYHWLDK
tara:strand:+ start:369 stop:578 length:210 start_codon:yes stop_codon:yes gene_type:complete